MNSLLSGFKNIRNALWTALLVSRYIVQGLVNAFVNRKDDLARRKQALKITAANCTKLLKRLGVEVDVNASAVDLEKNNYFMVCNHMSYVDILVLSSWSPAVFVTSVEMEKTFFLGDMAKLGGSFFVNRVNRRKMKDEVERLKSLVAKGLNVFIFPEGTSTNGVQGILPFKKSLFRVPFQANIPILPICLKYEEIDGQPFSKENCDRVCWYDDMTFAPHLYQLMGVRQMKVSIALLEPLNPNDYEDHGELAQVADKRIRDQYGDPKSWPEKN